MRRLGAGLARRDQCFARARGTVALYQRVQRGVQPPVCAPVLAFPAVTALMLSPAHPFPRCSTRANAAHSDPPVGDDAIARGPSGKYVASPQPCCRHHRDGVALLGASLRREYPGLGRSRNPDQDPAVPMGPAACPIADRAPFRHACTMARLVHTPCHRSVDQSANLGRLLAARSDEGVRSDPTFSRTR